MVHFGSLFSAMLFSDMFMVCVFLCSHFGIIYFRFEKQNISVKDLEEEISLLETVVSSHTSKEIVLCHNDISFGNLIFDGKKGKK